MSDTFLTTFIKLFFLLTPFFVMSMFVAVTDDMPSSKRQFTALKTTFAILVICLVVYFFGEYVFKYMGITIDAFRIGAGVILLITAIDLVIGKNKGGKMPENDDDGDISVVPMAIPYAIGPGTIGALLVMSGEAESLSMRFAHAGGIALAVATVGIMLLLANSMEKLLGKKGMQILCKITGLILAALAAQVIFTGVRNFLVVK
jgi:multiple antibiotic resistance protein